MDEAWTKPSITDGKWEPKVPTYCCTPGQSLGDCVRTRLQLEARLGLASQPGALRIDSNDSSSRTRGLGFGEFCDVCRVFSGEILPISALGVSPTPHSKFIS